MNVTRRELLRLAARSVVAGVGTALALKFGQMDKEVWTEDYLGPGEDLSDAIYNVEPFETPIVAWSEASPTMHEWQMDPLEKYSPDAHRRLVSQSKELKRDIEQMMEKA